MAVVKLSGLITDIRGKLGGSVFQQTQGGLTIRNIGSSVRTQSLNQIGRRKTLLAARNAWTALDDATRTAFQQAAIANPVYNTKKPGSALSGQATFIRQYVYRKTAGINTAPSPSFVNTPYTYPAAFAYLDGTALKLGFQFAPDNTKYYLIFYMTQRLGNGITERSAKFKQINIAAPFTNNMDITNQYTIAWGTVPVTGSKCYAKFAWANLDSNYVSPFFVIQNTL